MNFGSFFWNSWWNQLYSKLFLSLTFFYCITILPLWHKLQNFNLQIEEVWYFHIIWIENDIEGTFIHRTVGLFNINKNMLSGYLESRIEEVLLCMWQEFTVFFFPPILNHHESTQEHHLWFSNVKAVILFVTDQKHQIEM